MISYRLLSARSGLSLGRKLIKYVFISNSPSCPATTLPPICVPYILLVLWHFLISLCVIPTPICDHLLLASESNMVLFPTPQLCSLLVGKKYLKLKANNFGSTCHYPSNRFIYRWNLQILQIHIYTYNSLNIYL